MKKFLALLLTLAMMLSLMACGGNSGNSNDDTDTGSGVTNNDGDSDKKGGSAYKTFDDLSREMAINADFLLGVDGAEGELYLRCDVAPASEFHTESFVYGFVSNKLDAGCIVVSSGEYTEGLTVEDAFPAVWNDYGTSTLKQYDRIQKYDDFIPDTTEKVKVNGMDAIKFSGVQTGEDYGSPYSYDVYGYCMVIENVPVIIAAMAGEDAKTRSEDNMVTIKHYADEMIYTVRALDHWEEY